MTITTTNKTCCLYKLTITLFINRVVEKRTQTPAIVSSTREPTPSRSHTAAKSPDATKDTPTHQAYGNTSKPTSISPPSRQDVNHRIPTPSPQRNANALHQSTRSTHLAYHQ